MGGPLKVLLVMLLVLPIAECAFDFVRARAG